MSWNKGKRLSEEHKRKLSESHKGKKLSEETRRKIGEGHKNHSCYKNPERSRKISEALKGRKHSEETKIKISNALKGEKSPCWKGGRSWKYHDEARRIMGLPREDSRIVHHIDGDWTNNHPDNLMVLLDYDHRKLHGLQNYHNLPNQEWQQARWDNRRCSDGY